MRFFETVFVLMLALAGQSFAKDCAKCTRSERDAYIGKNCKDPQSCSTFASDASRKCVGSGNQEPCMNAETSKMRTCEDEAEKCQKIKKDIFDLDCKSCPAIL
jgi:hypothetical protein